VTDVVLKTGLKAAIGLPLPAANAPLP
jgi:hypothetical protein